MSKFRKALIPLLAAVVQATQGVLDDGTVDTTEWGVIIGAFVTSLLVYLTPNRAEGAPKASA